MFDNAPVRSPSRPRDASGARIGPEDERIALRCNRRELQLVDSFVANGEFPTRSDLMRAALREFLRARVTSAALPSREASDTIEVAVPLRRDEVAILVAHTKLVGHHRSLGDLLAELVRRGEMEAKVRELVERQRLSLRDSREVEAQVEELGRAGRRLEDRGVVGR
ncbi:MAG TPA: ribbon-helix-helix domain-containing protein [Thermoplasmata archaeon]|nr:ribbon-helix-helix domain-containing protein [Thermoplasmata archaeon]HUJ78673.1 ribbon-helix-helix domain-containing protein [Thermoplasmata archaeon]